MSCTEEEEITSSPSVSSLGNTWPVSTDAVFTDQDTTTTEVTTEDNVTTEHEDDINQSPTITSTSTAHDLNLITEHKLPVTLNNNNFNRLNIDNTLDLGLLHNNNLQSNYIPKIGNGDNYVTNEQLEKIEDEKHMQHKMLHEEIARLGNLENIFTQPTDHFVPPLVMAKAKISDDMTVLSLKEKHAQQLAEQNYYKPSSQYRQNDHVYHSNIIKPTTEDPKPDISGKELLMHVMKNKDGSKKSTMPKKYNEKMDDPKNKALKAVETKLGPSKNAVQSSTKTPMLVKQSETTPMTNLDKIGEDAALDLTVFLKDEPEIREEKIFYTNYSGDVSKLEVINNGTLNNDTEIKLVDIEATEEIKHENPFRKFDESTKNITLNHEVIKITIISEGHTTVTPTTFDITTKVPILQDTTVGSLPASTVHKELANDYHNNSEILSTTQSNIDTTEHHYEIESVSNMSGVADISTIKNETVVLVSSTTTEQIPTTTKAVPIATTTQVNNITSFQNNDPKETTTAADPSAVDLTHDMKIEPFSDETHDEFGSNSTDPIDDFQSPLLSGANEPVHRPNRSRRPQQPNRNRFNPLRILG